MTDQTRSHPMCWRGDHYEHDCARPSGRTCIDCGAPAGTEGDPHDGCDCGDWGREAEIAVRAALPSIEHQLRELIAQAIEALPNLSVNQFGTRPLPDLIRKDTAARIARGDASND